MMKKLGCLMFIAGVLIFAGAFAMFGATIWQAMDARKVTATEIRAGTPLTTEVLAVSPDKACQVSVVLELKPAQVKKTKGMEGNTEYAAVYKFPFSYSVKTPDGAEVTTGKEPLSSDAGTRVFLEDDLTESGGTARIRHNLAKFDVKGQDKIKVEALIRPDTTTGTPPVPAPGSAAGGAGPATQPPAPAGAQLIKAELEVYDNVARHGKSVGIGVMMLAGGPVLGVLGILVFLAGLVFDSGRRTRRTR